MFECFEESLDLLMIFNKFKLASLWIFQQHQLNNYVNFIDEGKSSICELIFPKEATTKSHAMRGKKSPYLLNYIILSNRYKIPYQFVYLCVSLFS